MPLSRHPAPCHDAVTPARHPVESAGASGLRAIVTIVTMQAGEFLARVRRECGLTQAQLAARARLTQSVVSAYERGRREPTLPMIQRLARAAGGELTLGFARASLLERVRAVRDELLQLFQEFGGEDVRVFGSAARGEDTAESDVDLLFRPRRMLDVIALAELQIEAERIIGTAVDVVPEDALRRDIRDRVLREAVPL